MVSLVGETLALLKRADTLEKALSTDDDQLGSSLDRLGES